MYGYEPRPIWKQSLSVCLSLQYKLKKQNRSLRMKDKYDNDFDPLDPRGAQDSMRSDTRQDSQSKNLTKLSHGLAAYENLQQNQQKNSMKVPQKPRDEILDQFDDEWDENQSKDENEKQSSDSSKSAKSSDEDKKEDQDHSDDKSNNSSDNNAKGKDKKPGKAKTKKQISKKSSLSSQKQESLKGKLKRSLTRKDSGGNISTKKTSVTGVEIGSVKQIGSFFSSLRLKKENDRTSNLHSNFKGTSKITGEEYVDHLIKQQETQYQKKFAFEKGQFHQCIHNPKKEGQMITVQQVEKVLEGWNLRAGSKNHEGEDDEEPDPFTEANKKADVYKEIKTISQQYQKYKLAPIDDEEDNDKDQLKIEEEKTSSPTKKGTGSIRKGITNRLQSQPSLLEDDNFTSYVNGDNPAVNKEKAALYKDRNLNEKIDPVTGVDVKVYAKAKKDPTAQSNSTKARMRGQRFAVVGFWDLDKDDKFVCTHFFIIPNPMVRNILDKEGTRLDQILYPSDHTDDIFFFFKGRQENRYGYEAIPDFNMQVAFLNLVPTDAERQERGDSRHIYDNCPIRQTIPEGSILEKYINDLHGVEYEGEDNNNKHADKQMPNPTVIDTVETMTDIEQLELVLKEKDDSNELIAENQASLIKKTVIFTAFLSEKVISKDKKPRDKSEQKEAFNIDEEISSIWYPTVFFFDLDKCENVWEIFGADQFINIDEEKSVLVRTSDIGAHSKDTYHTIYSFKTIEKNQKDLHYWQEDNFFQKIAYMTYPMKQHILPKNRKVRAPQHVCLNNHKINFDSGNGLNKAKNSQVVESRVHNNGERVTLLYNGLGSYTFKFIEHESLQIASKWTGMYDDIKFHVNLTFSSDRRNASGEGVDENDDPVTAQITLRPKETNNWSGYFISQKGKPKAIEIQNLCVDEAQKDIGAQYKDDEGQVTTISGKLGRMDISTQFNLCSFEFDDGTDQVRVFEGQIDDQRSNIKGQWYFKDSEVEDPPKYNFKLELAEAVPGKVTLSFKDKEEKNVEVTFNHEDKKMFYKKKGEDVKLLEGIECIDQAELIYFISQPDVGFVRTNDKSKLLIQAKMTSIAEDELESKGTGVAETSIALYNVAEDLEGARAGTSQKKIAAKEPMPQFLHFYLPQSSLRTQELKESYLWNVNDAIIDVNGRYFGSLIYEEYTTEELSLNFFSSSTETLQNDKDKANNASEKLLDFPQSPLEQRWIVDYPLMAYNYLTPKNREIIIIHLAQNVPQRVINLGEWEFMSFVNHTQMVEQKLFKKDKETNSDIFFLVRRKDQIRLMSFKSNPWLQVDEKVAKSEPDVVKQSLYLFSGVVKFELEEHKDNTEANLEARRQSSRRFNNDKIQNVQLITKTLGSCDHYMFIIQFDDCIVKASINEDIFKIVCKPEDMIRRHLIRGYNDKIFYAESQGNVDKIQKLEFHASKPDKITKQEIFQLPGSTLVAFEPDSELMADDIEEGCSQSLIVMDDQQKIFFLVNENNIRFEVRKIIDFSHHNKLKDVTEMVLNDWQHVHVTQQTLTFGKKIHNLNSTLEIDNSVPKRYFGQEKEVTLIQKDLINSDSESSDDELDSDEEEENTDWSTQSVQAMSMTANMITQSHLNHKEFCFVVKPAPGSRKITTLGYQWFSEARQILFVSDSHILMTLRGGRAITLLQNGSVVHQPKEVADLFETKSKIVGESHIFEGKKTILIEKKVGKNLDKKLHIALEFDSQGQARVVGTFKKVYKEMKQNMQKYVQKAEDEQKAERIKKKIKEQENINNTLVEAKFKESKDKQRHDSSLSMSLNESTLVGDPQTLIEKTKIKFSDLNFVTEEGEIVKIAAIVSPYTKIREELKKQKENAKKKGKTEQDDAEGEDDEDDEEEEENKQAEKKIFYTIFENQRKLEKDFQLTTNEQQFLNNDEDEAKNAKTHCKYKVYVFHLQDKKHMNKFVKEGRFIFNGEYICHRSSKNSKTIWVTNLKKNQDKSVLVCDYFDGKPEQEATKTRKNKDKRTKMYNECTSRGINVKDMVTGKTDLKHIQLNTIPKTSYKTIRTNGKKDYMNNLLQVTIRAHAMIYDLDTKNILEVDSIENIDSFQDPNSFLDTGFQLTSSQSITKKKEKIICRKKIITNAHANMLFEKSSEAKEGAKQESNSGRLYRSFSEIDIFALREIFLMLKDGHKIPHIDLEAFLSIYEGHTVFSIFFDYIEVFEHILAQFQQAEFENEEDLNGLDVEHNILRRLYRILNFPTSDFLHKDLKKLTKAKKAELDQLNKTKSYMAAVCCRKKTQDEGKGYLAIPKKSLHFQNARFRESLMELSTLCQEIQIEDFVQNLGDIQILFKSMSPAVVVLFQHGYYQTRFTKQVKNLDWRVNDELRAIGQNHSVITEKSANDMLNNGSDEADTQKRLVEVQLLKIDWVYAAYDGMTTVGFRELIVALAKAPNETLFSTDLVVTLINHFGTRYYNAIFMRCFIPYIIYFITAICYVSNYTLSGIDPEERWSLTIEFFMRWVFLLGTFYFEFFELLNMKRDGWGYFKDVFNFVDSATFILNIYLVYVTVTHQQDEDDEDSFVIRSLASIAILLQWIKTFYWMRLFTNTSFYVRLIRETLSDIRFFLILFVFILMTFANTLMIIGDGRDEGPDGSQGGLYKDVFDTRFLNAVTNQYMLSLGEFDLANYKGGNNDSLAWAVFITTTFIIQITFLNMLIAIMGDTFARVSEIKEQSALKEKIEILSDFVYIVERESYERKNHFEYIFDIRPKSENSGKNTDWEGTVTQIKKALAKTSLDSKANFNRKFKTIMSEVEQVNIKIGSLDEKLADLKSAMQRIPDQMKKLINQSKEDPTKKRLDSAISKRANRK